MEIGAYLERLELAASDPQTLAKFYCATFGLQQKPSGNGIECFAPGRELAFVPGQAGQLRRASFRFHDSAAFEGYAETLRSRGVEMLEASPERITVADPRGNQVAFLRPAAESGPFIDGQDSARLQHFGLRAPALEPLVDFYAGKLGFIVSDRVLDEAGELTAAFMRTNHEHHALALFRAPKGGFDHFSCEVAGWQQMRDWADHMAGVGVDLAWGIGRHGPGNDTFLMVRDPEGNMGEISAELEICSSDRPAGVWPHRPQTLNQWGVAIMRN